MIEETPKYPKPEEAKIVVSYSPPKTDGLLWPAITSIILHPLLMGVYTVSLLFLYTDFNLLFAGQFIQFISPVLFLTCIVPVSGMYFLQRSGLMKRYRDGNIFDRLLPMLLLFFTYSLLIYYFHSAKLFIWFLAVLTVPLVLIVTASIISIKWRISLHMLAIGGMIGSTLSVCYNIKGVNPFILFIILFILAGFLGVARLIPGKETPAQVYTSFLIGLVVSFICVWLGTYWGIIMFLKNL